MNARKSTVIAACVAAALMLGLPADVGLGQPQYPQYQLFGQQYPPGYIPNGRPPPGYYAQPVRPQRQQQQQQQQPMGFFDMLFGPRQVSPPPPQFQPPSVTRRAPRIEPLDSTPVVDVTPKDPKARKIMVIGDFVAGGLAWGLDQTFAAEPKVAVVDDSESSSGLVRDDYYDWNAQLPTLLNKEKPDIIVMAIGANDRQPMRDPKARSAPHTDAWEEVYVKRIAGIVDTLKVYGRPFFWMSAPPMRDGASSKDMAYLNGFYEKPVAAAGGHFIDIWNGFTDDNGNFLSSGPDVDGQPRALRTGDGISFTRAGRLKLAFYIAREIRKSTGIGGGVVDLLASVSQQSQIEIGKDGVKRMVGPVISLTDPLPGASDVLAGGAAKPASAPAADTPQTLLIVKGVALPVVPGRADDFMWPPRHGTVVVAPVAAATPIPPAVPASTAGSAAAGSKAPVSVPAKPVKP